VKRTNEFTVGNGIAVIVITLDRYWSETAYLSQYYEKRSHFQRFECRFGVCVVCSRYVIGIAL